MSEEKNEQTTTEETVTTQPTVSETLQAAAWDDPIDVPASPETATATAETTTTTEAATTETTTKPDDEEVLDHNEWIKREFGVEDVSVLKTEREEYKKLKEKAPVELTFADEQSKQIHELIRTGKKKEVKEFLETQEKLENLVTTEVNEDTAADIIKLSLKLKHKELTDKEIEYKFNKTYSIPKEPVQGDLEADDDFSQRLSDWKERVEDIKMSMIIDAKTARPELDKFRTELSLPEIQKWNTEAKKEPTPEDLAAFDKAKESFLQSAKQTIEGFNGITASVKDKDVDYAVTYAPSQEEKTLLSDKLIQFSEAGFDANQLFAERWWDTKTNTFKIDQMTEDLSRIFMGKNADQKIATDSANKRIEAYLKEKKQVNVTETSANSTFSPSNNKTDMDKVRDLAFA